MQIVADQGSDLKKSIETYQSRHSEVVYTPDLTHKTEFDRTMSATIGKDIYQRHQRELRHLASIGRQRFNEKFCWLGEYKNDLKKHQQMVDVIEASEIQLKHKGLHSESAQQFMLNNQNIELDVNAKTLQTQIVHYMDTNHGGVKLEQARLVSSDIIESIFGQFKQVGHSSCLQEIGKMVLFLPLLVMKITPDLVLQAMSNVKTSAVNEWGEEMFGKSALALRNSPLSHAKINIESA